MKSSQLLLSIVVLVVVSLTSAEGLSLSLSYPVSGNPTVIRLTCKNSEGTAATATFQRNGEEITDQVSVIINSMGVLVFTFSPNQELGGRFTCTDNGITSNTVTLPGAILINELTDQTVKGGSTVEFVCEAIASDYQPEIVWMFGSKVYTDCSEDSRYCVQSNEFKSARLTRSKFVIKTEEKSSIHLITCYVTREQRVRDTATLKIIVNTDSEGGDTTPAGDDKISEGGGQSGGSTAKEAEIIGGSVGTLVVLITSTVITTLVVMWRRYVQKKKKKEAASSDIDPESSVHLLGAVSELVDDEGEGDIGDTPGDAGTSVSGTAGETGDPPNTS